MAWAFVGVSNVVEVTATPHALVTTGITGLAAGDLLVACISSRIASTTSVTLPLGWTLVSEQKNNNVLSTGSAAASGLMAYCVRGATDPALTFTHPTAPTVAIGRIVAYRDVSTSSPKDTQTSFTTAISITAVSGTGLTTTVANDLIVAMAAGGQEAAWSSFNATSPAGASGATSTAAPTTTWLERADSLTTTGADTSLAIFDAIKATAGATGNLTATASVAAAHVVVAGAFRIAAAVITGSGGAPSARSTVSGVGTRTTIIPRYWVGGSGTWDTTAGSKWSFTSGGPPGASAPGTINLNDVYFDANSGSGTVTLASNLFCQNLDCAGFTGSLSGPSTLLEVHGSVFNLGSAASISLAEIDFLGSLEKSISLTGHELASTYLYFDTARATFLDTVVAHIIEIGDGVLDANDQNISVANAYLGFGTALLGNGTWTVSEAWSALSSGVAVTAENSTIRIAHTNDAAVFEFTGGGHTYNIVENVGSSTNALHILDANTFNILDIANGSDNRVVKFQAGTTTTVQELRSSAGVGHTLTSVTGAPHTLSDTSGTNTLDKTTVSWSNATGGAAWVGGEDGGNTSGWTFGVAGVAGAGALVATTATVAGAGLSSSDGTGIAVSQSSAASGTGVSASSGTGAAAADAATVAGVGVVSSAEASGTGALVAQAVAVAGTGAVVSSGIGTVAATDATVGGAGASASTGTGNAVAEPAAVAGTGTAAAANSGALAAESAAVEGDGLSSSDGVGAVAAGAAAIVGTGLSVSTGSGELACSPATVAGVGVVLEEGAATGSGELLAGAATISGEGEVTGEVAPPITEGSGGYHYRPDRRPLPVEGYGYGILPQIEGEAYGVVAAAGRSIGTLPRLAGLADATAGAAGSSSAHLTVKAAALGNAGARGKGSGMIVKFEGAAVGRHDDDEAAVMAWLLAA